MKLSNETYDLLCWICETVVPAIIVCYGTIGAAMSLPCTEIVLTVMGALNVCVGRIVSSSRNSYTGHEDEVVEDDEEEEDEQEDL